MKEETNTIQENTSSFQRLKSDWRSIKQQLNGNMVLHQLRFAVFLSLLLLFYINQTQRGIALQKQLSTNEKVIKELRWKYMDIKAALAKSQSETRILTHARNIELQPLTIPAYRISKTNKSKQQTD